VISEAKKAGLSRTQVIEVIESTNKEEVFNNSSEANGTEILDAIYFKIKRIYGSEATEAESEEMKAEAQAKAMELSHLLSICRPGDNTEVDSSIPDIFQEPLCGDIIHKAKELNISYAMITDILDDLTSDDMSGGRMN